MGESRGRGPVLAILALAAITVGAVLGGGSEPLPRPPDAAAEAPAITTPELVRIHVSGLVRSPGVVDVPAGSIVADAIDAAGGLDVGANLSGMNLAAPVGDGDLLVVPGPGVEAPAGSASTPGAGGLLPLSTATATELENLPGVGPVLAARVVSFREQNGAFESIEDLLEVPGIGEAKLAAIRDLVRP